MTNTGSVRLAFRKMDANDVETALGLRDFGFRDWSHLNGPSDEKREWQTGVMRVVIDDVDDWDAIANRLQRLAETAPEHVFVGLWTPWDDYPPIDIGALIEGVPSIPFLGCYTGDYGHEPVAFAGWGHQFAECPAEADGAPYDASGLSTQTAHEVGRRSSCGQLLRISRLPR